MRKEKKNHEKAKKGIKAQETQMLGGILKSLEKVTSKIKRVCPSKAIKKKKQQRKKNSKISIFYLTLHTMYSIIGKAR